MKIVFYTYSGEGALSVLRLLGPARQVGINVIKGYENGIFDISHIQECDVVVIQRDFCRDLQNYQTILHTAHKFYKLVVLDLDDNLLELPFNHPDRQSGYYTEALIPILQAINEVDLITVATPILHDFIQTFNKNVRIIPNYLNDNFWSLREPDGPKPGSEIVTIGYMAGNSHQPDIQMLAPVLLKLIKENEKKVHLSFWGIEPPDFLKPFSSTDWVPAKSNSYNDFAIFMQTQKADIVISPLIDNYFNSCKSPIKFLEYGALGIPGVFSNLAPYSSVITNEVNGFLASNSDEWESCLQRLIDDPQLRTTIASNAQEIIKEKWLLSNNAKEQFSIYSEIISTQIPRDNRQSINIRVLRSISQQVYDWQQELKIENIEIKENIQQLSKKKIFDENSYKEVINNLNIQIGNLESNLLTLEKDSKQIIENKEEMISELKIKIDEAQAYINSLQYQLYQKEEEVLNYATSVSWNLTRPLRKILRFFKRH